MRMSRQVSAKISRMNGGQIDHLGTRSARVSSERVDLDVVFESTRQRTQRSSTGCDNVPRAQSAAAASKIEARTQRPAQRISSVSSSGIGQFSSPSRCRPSPYLAQMDFHCFNFLAKASATQGGTN